MAAVNITTAEIVDEKIRRIAEELAFYMDCRKCPRNAGCEKGADCGPTLYNWLKGV